LRQHKAAASCRTPKKARPPEILFFVAAPPRYAETLSSEPLVELDVDPVVLVVESLLSSVLRLELDDDPSSL
jgi:hypothetical protein